MSEELLRRAAFAAPPDAARAWRELSRTGASFDAPGDARLLPAAYRNLRAAGLTDAELPRVMREHARAAAIRSRLALRQAADVVTRLEAAGIAPLLLKGAALIAGGYCEPSARPMSDVDVLVRPGEAAAAVAALRGAGWTGGRAVADAVRYRHAALLRRGEWECDLHWWALWESPDPEADERFRRGSERVELLGVPVAILRPEHQLLQVVVHGTRAFEPVRGRWVGDALAVLRHRAGGFDWELLVTDARLRRAERPLADALSYLSEAFAVAVPASALAALQATGRRGARLYEPGSQKRPNPSLAYLRSLLIVAGRREQGSRMRWLVRNLEHTLGVQGARRLPLALVRRAGRVAVRALAQRRSAKAARPTSSA